jgi:membrane associated rhomboid family serine protease
MNHDMKKLFTRLSEKKADLIILILTSQNIESHVEQENRSFNILVNEADMENARIIIDAYYKENKFFRIKQQLQEIPLSSFKSYPAFFIMGLLWLVHAICIHYHIHQTMILKYGASALFILQGETYRAITALFLHSDAQHLVGNMAGMLLFGAPFISLSGFGTGPFMLLFVGTIGNLINAHLYKNAHLSIGASTAIMGAAGLLVAFQVIQKEKKLRLNNLMPIFAGVVLLGMLSQGERTDVMAHVFGFLSGFFSGIIFFPLNKMLQFSQKDPIALFITLFILACSLLAAT